MFCITFVQIGVFDWLQGSKCPSLPGFTHWVNPGWVLSLILEKVGNTG